MNNNVYKKVNFANLLDNYSLFLFDAYGVLVNSQGTLPNTIETLHKIKDANKDFIIVTNDASRNPQVQLEHYKNFGFPVKENNIVSSGMIVKDYFLEKNLSGAKTLVLGPEESYGYLDNTGAEILPFNIKAEPEVVVILNESFTQDLSESFKILLTTILNQLNKGIQPVLILANPDLNYPSGANEFSFAPGSIALTLEASLARNFPMQKNTNQFVGLGKPFERIFKKALGDNKKETTIFFGDQFETDILGANNYGIDSALVLTGINKEEQIDIVDIYCRPRFVLNDLL